LPAGPDNSAPTGAVAEIIVDALDPATMDLWRTVAKVAKTLDDQHMRWCLVGGLMVALFAMEAGQISRPTSMRVHSRPEDQRQDVIQLLGLMTDPRSVIDGLTKAERKWLRVINDKLALGDQQLDATIDAASLRIARAAYRRLTD
jgi:hypothetical protein